MICVYLIQVVTVPVYSPDCIYPPLDWIRFALKKMFAQVSLSNHWFTEQVTLARYAHMPVGNLPADPRPAIHDVFFARMLKKNNHLLWMSPTDKPDLGGREYDDHRLMAELDDDVGLVINEPGNYSTVCVELNLKHLAVGSILQSGHINDIEGGVGGLASFDNVPMTSLEDMMVGGAPDPANPGFAGRIAPASSLTNFDETAQCAPAFRILKGGVVLKGGVLY